MGEAVDEPVSLQLHCELRDLEREAKTEENHGEPSLGTTARHPQEILDL